MFNGVHAVLFSPAAEAVRAFFRDALGLPFVDAGDGWLIFALPPAELAVHPAEASRHEIYLLCDDLDATVGALEAKGVRLAQPITEQAWGRLTAITLPDGSGIGLYQPSHPRPSTP
jgi:catechol 2,3-dioxygenase-like lactoylglutathione lyase family enzyme